MINKALAFVFNLACLHRLLSNIVKAQFDKISVGPPKPRNGFPLILNTSFFVGDINSFDAHDMDFRLDFELHHKWIVNRRLCKEYALYLHVSGNPLVENNTIIIKQETLKDMLWLPDTYITTAKKVSSPSQIISSRLMKMSKEEDGCSVLSIERLAALITCPMEFKEYPVDIQNCPVLMRSYTYPVDIIKYSWMSNVEQNPNLKLLRHVFTVTQDNLTESLMNVTYSYLRVNFTFERIISHHFIQVYAPSTMLVVLSWFTFWLGLEAIPGRVTIPLVCLLALVTQFSGLRKELPAVSYITNVDVWMVVCMLFVFSSLFELAIIKQIHLRKTKSINKNPQRVNMKIDTVHQNKVNLRLIRIHPTEAWSESQEKSRKPVRNMRKETDWVVRVDNGSKILFPFAFLVFNAFYWPIVLCRIV